ncbi:MAG: FAD-binding oxidoreductase [Chloroflexota bacterium]
MKAFGTPYWLDWKRPFYPTFETDTIADVAIVGAGITGLKLAAYLAKFGIKSVILEGNRVGSGASGRNQGSINHGGALSYTACIGQHSRPVAKAAWQLGLENHRLLRNQIEAWGIACDYQVDGFTYLSRGDLPSGEDASQSYRTDYELLNEDGFAVAYLDAADAQALGGSSHYLNGFTYLTDAQFHAGKYVVGLANAVAQLPQVTLYENSRVLAIEPAGTTTRLRTKQATLTASHIFLATNALVPQFVPELAPSLRAERGQVFVTQPLDERPCVGSFGADMAWWREIIEPNGRFRLLFGGGRGRDEPDSLFPQFTAAGNQHPLLESEGFSPSEAHQARLDSQFAQLFPQLRHAKITHRWGGLQSFVADSFPQVGLLDPERNIYGIAGLCGRGNCYSNVAAVYLAGKIAGVVSKVEQQFGSLFETVMVVKRPLAAWPQWTSVY